MLKKVFKYDFKSVWRYWWIVAVVFLAATLVFSVGIRGYIEYSDYYSKLPYDHSVTLDLIMIFSSMSLFAVIIFEYLILAAFSLMSTLIVSIRYYKNFFSDNGYLTFTLPVKRSTHLMSKVLSGVLWNTVTAAVATVGVGMMMLIIPPTYGDGIFNFTVFRELFEVFGEIFESSPGWTIVYLIIGTILLAATMFYSSVIIPLCITIGSTVAKKHKVLASIGVYFGLSFVISMGSEIMYFISILMTSGLTSIIMWASANEISTVVAAFGILASAMIATVGIIAYNINLNIIERKLNLA